MPPSPEKKPDPVDIQSILLPKKDPPAGGLVTSASRINAGALLRQEEEATLLKPDAAAPAPTKTPVFASAPAESAIRPLQTYQGDIEKVVSSGHGASVVSIASAEATRRGTKPLDPQTAEEKSSRRLSWTMIAGGIVLVIIALCAAGFVILRNTTVPASQAPNAPFLTVDESVSVEVPAAVSTRDTVMASLEAARRSMKLSVGLIEWVYIAEPAIQDNGAPRQLSAAELLQLIAPQTPPELLRTLAPVYLLGLHSFEENQAFLLLQIESYETAYRAMLQWEYTLRGELLPLFGRTPSPKQTGTPAPASTTPQLINTGFVDKIVENRDTRAYLNAEGDILLLWTFLGRNTILITTNEYTLREVLSRLDTTPLVPIPGQ